MVENEVKTLDNNIHQWWSYSLQTHTVKSYWLKCMHCKLMLV